jgi:hypothetical protein
MPPRKNPLQLNPLQLKTLTLLQELARLPEYSGPAAAIGEIAIKTLPHPHGDHFHLGDAIVAARDATGLANRAVWVALARKGLVRPLVEGGVVLTAEGVGYPTGMRTAMLKQPAD